MLKYLFLLVLSTQALAIDCEIHKVFCKIKELRPNMGDKEAMDLSNLIYKESKDQGGDPLLAVAIAMQETSLKDKSRTQMVIKFGPDDSWRVEEGVTDVCMFQFHVRTIIYYKMDPVKLRDDAEYCVHWHFKLMNIKKKACRDLGDEAWTCYHSRTKVLRKHYKKLVERHLRLIL